MKTGDLLHVNGDNGDGTISTWYAELSGIDENGNLEVFFLRKKYDYIWAFHDEWDTISPESVEAIFTPITGQYIKIYKQFGFTPTEAENQFLKVGDQIPKHVVVPLPLDNESDFEDDSDSDMGDFVVPDEIANEPFTLAPETSDFVRETHQAVREFNHWAPKTPDEEKVKVFVENMSDKYQKQDDERQFVAGKVVDYTNPSKKE